MHRLGRTSDVYEWGHNEVLKLFKDGCYNEDEVKNSIIINNLGIPSPYVVGIVEIENRKGIIYERIKGKTMMQSINEVESSLSKYAGIMAELHALIHSKKLDMEPNLKQEFIRKIKFTTKLNKEKKDFVIDNLNTLPDSNSICHCDFHPDNIILSSRGPVVIDWVNSLIGNPLADVARTSLMLRSYVLPPEPTPYWIKNRTSRLKFHSIYLEEYLKLCVLDVKEFEIWELPVAAVRLGENIVEEEQQLLFSIDNRIYQNINDIPNSVQ